MRINLRHIFALALTGVICIPAMAASKGKPAKAVKARATKVRIVEIDYGKEKMSNARKPARVNGKQVTYVPQQVSGKRRLVVDPQAGFSEESFDAVVEAVPKKSARMPQSTAVKSNAEIQAEDLESAMVIPADAPTSKIAQQSSADKVTLKRLKRNADKSLDDDYF
jgi:hypothetical protein